LQIVKEKNMASIHKIISNFLNCNNDIILVK
jgi:hypothetical protein